MLSWTINSEKLIVLNFFQVSDQEYLMNTHQQTSAKTSGEAYLVSCVRLNGSERQHLTFLDTSCMSSCIRRFTWSNGTWWYYNCVIRDSGTGSNEPEIILHRFSYIHGNILMRVVKSWPKLQLGILQDDMVCSLLSEMPKVNDRFDGKK